MSYCIADITMQEIICSGVLSKSCHEKVWKIYRKTPAVETFLANSCFDRTPPDGCFYVEEVIMSANLQENVYVERPFLKRVVETL